MIKTEYLKFRATQEEAREIDRICKLLGLSRSEYLRAVAFGAPAPASTPAPAATVAATPEDAMRNGDQEQEQEQEQGQAGESASKRVRRD